jgi:3-oxoacyl-[acyl-carrier-protein] synthase II
MYVTLAASAVAMATLTLTTNATFSSLWVATKAQPLTTMSQSVLQTQRLGVQRDSQYSPNGLQYDISKGDDFEFAHAPATTGATPAPASQLPRVISAGCILFGAVAAMLRLLQSTTAKFTPVKPMEMSQDIAMAATTGAPRKRIVVTGMGICSVFGNDVDEYYSRLCDGESGVKLIDKFDTEKFSTKFAAQITDFSSEGLIPKKFDRKYDDVIRYAVVAAKKALMEAGIEKTANPEAWEKLNKPKVGVLIGSGMGGLDTMETNITSLGTEKGVKALSPFTIPYSYANMGGSLVTIEQGFMGPNYSIATACATANYCFHDAANHIRSGRADVMVAGGTEASVCPVGLGGFVACRALSKNNDNFQTASRAWDKTRDGFVMGEGAGVLVLESEEHAKARGATIIAEYLGGAINCDAHHVTMPRDDGMGVASCMEMAIKDAGIEKDQVNYINAHATSTPLGDVAEVNAIKSVFSNMDGIKMNATKSMIGHCLGAAGGMEAVAVIKAITSGVVHPTINVTDPIDEVANIDFVHGEAAKHEVTAGLSNSFGFGGHNSVVVFGPYKEE